MMRGVAADLCAAAADGSRSLGLSCLLQHPGGQTEVGGLHMWFRINTVRGTVPSVSGDLCMLADQERCVCVRLTTLEGLL